MSTRSFLQLYQKLLQLDVTSKKCLEDLKVVLNWDDAEKAMVAEEEGVTEAEEDKSTEEEGCTRLSLIASLSRYKICSRFNTMLPLTFQGNEATRHQHVKEGTPII